MKERLNICIDIDGTITEPFYWIEYANKFFNVNIKEEDISKYEITEVLNISDREFAAFYNRYGQEMHLNAKARENANKVLWSLSQRHNIFYVTAREERLRDITVQWFKDNNLPLTELFMLGSHHKVNKAKELNCNIFLEDRYDNALELSEAGIKVLLIDCLYNRFPLYNRIERVLSWNQIDYLIKLDEVMKAIA